MSLTRTTHWATREFNDFLVANLKTPFAWGTYDCCLMAADAIQAFTGTDIADDFRGRYTTQVGAFRLIKTITGGATVEDAAVWCANKHGLTEWPSPLCAQRGDLVVIQDAEELIAGVVHLNGLHVVSIGTEGLKLLPLSSVKRAWRV